MKYTNKNSEYVLTALPKIKNKYQFRYNHTENVERIKSPTSTDSDNGREQPQNMSHADIDFMSMHASQVMKRPFQNYVKTQKELIEDEEMKALAHKRLYFKSLIDLQQNVKTAEEKHMLKQVLVKCGVFKPSGGKKFEEE